MPRNYELKNTPNCDTETFERLLAVRGVCLRGHDLRARGYAHKSHGHLYLGCRECDRLRSRGEVMPPCARRQSPSLIVGEPACSPELFAQLLAHRSSCFRGHDLRLHGRYRMTCKTPYLVCRECTRQRRRGVLEKIVRTVCERGHLLAEHGVQRRNRQEIVCNKCRREYYRKRRQERLNERFKGALIPHGKSVDWAIRSAARKHGVQTQRERYGPSLIPTDSLVSKRTKRRAWLRVNGRQQLRCKHGHRWTPENTIWRRNKRRNLASYRVCRVCERLRNRRNWIYVQDASGHFVWVSIKTHNDYYLHTFRQLRAAVVAAHPDVGGTNRKFRNAHSELKRFQLKEEQWYKSVGRKLPTLKELKVA